MQVYFTLFPFLIGTSESGDEWTQSTKKCVVSIPHRDIRKPRQEVLKVNQSMFPFLIGTSESGASIEGCSEGDPVSIPHRDIRKSSVPPIHSQGTKSFPFLIGTSERDLAAEEKRDLRDGFHSS